MLSKTLGILGGVLFVAGTGLLAFFAITAAILGVAKTQYYGGECGVDLRCQLTPEICSDVTNELSFSDSIISESDSLALTVYLSNNDTRTCTAGVVLNAPNFDISPAQTTLRLEIPPGHNTHSIVWILTPRRAGRFPIIVETGGVALFYTLGEIKVTDILGLTPLQAKLLSYLGSFGGTMLTAPWWYEQWAKRKEKTKQAEFSRKGKK